jgi:hypothetical protein
MSLAATAALRAAPAVIANRERSGWRARRAERAADALSARAARAARAATAVECAISPHPSQALSSVGLDWFRALRRRETL